ncbi:MAG: hypothetical protein QMD71_00170 [bacterium]|nr:hypothetical protein [bacterium]
MAYSILTILLIGILEESWQPALFDALSYIKMTPQDVYITSQPSDTFCLPLVLDLLKRPIQSPKVVDSIALTLKDAELSELVDIAGICINSTLSDSSRVHLDSLAAKRALQLHKEPLQFLLSQITLANNLLKRTTAQLDSSELNFLKENLPKIILEDTTFKDKNPYEKKIAEEESKEIVKKCLNLLKKVNRDEIMLSAYVIGNAITQTLPGRDTPWRVPTIKYEGKVVTPVATGDVVFAKRMEYGWIVIGGPGETIYTGDPAVVIDLGGDDKYYGKVGSGSSGVSVCIDFSGNDLYLSSMDYNLGSGFFGVGFLLDFEGNDIYSSGNFSHGSGLVGVGILWDTQGNDKYFSDTHSQGAGSFGVGVLKDLSGNDSYHGALYVQGFGGTFGFGALVDSAGNDVYYAGGKYKDWLRYEDHFLSLSQGFGYGIRPYASGGIGILADFHGNDSYVSDIFGQGCSYWYALGGLIDYEGNDVYSSYQYAQGAGVHIGIGVLIDKFGDDSYFAKGVSQGCGHDYATGILIDGGGNDSYSAYDLSQGAGNANAVSILIDIDGNDNYLIRDKETTHGFSDLRRDFGGIGVILDLGGKDKYSGYGDNNSIWVHSTYGVGIDKEIESLK